MREARWKKFVLDEGFCRKIGSLDKPLELYDQSGRLLGLLTPATESSLECPVSEEELDRRSQETEVYSTSEV